MDQAPLTALASFLSAAGWNYSVFLQCYSVPFTTGVSTEDALHSALGPDVVIDSLRAVSAAEASADIRAALTYAGDSGAGPEPEQMQSPRFLQLLDAVMAQFDRAATQAHGIDAFWIEAGHPAYPVFWDFSFLLKGDEDAILFVGSSSD